MGADDRRDPASRETRGAVLLLGNYRPTISLVRALRPLGYRTVVGLGGGEGGAEHSRFTDEVWDHPPVEDEVAFHAALSAFLAARPDVSVVLPVTEAFCVFLARWWDRLPRDRRYATPAPQLVTAALDKHGAYALAARVGLPVAPLAEVATYPELLAAVERIGYPIIVRPVASTRRLGERKALILRDAIDLARELSAWPEGHPGLLLQRKVKGRRHNIYFAAQRGRLVRHVEAAIDRTDAPDGTGLAVEGRTVAPSPDLLAHMAAIVREMNYTGIGCAQFLVDRGGDGINFLELNPRVAGSHAVAEAAGIELGAAAIGLADPDAGELEPRAGRSGFVYAWSYGDLRGLKAALRGRAVSPRQALRWLGVMVRTALVADMHMTWSWRDPMPTCALFWRQAAPRQGGEFPTPTLGSQTGATS